MTTRGPRGQGSVFQRADGYWVGSIDAPYGVDGKRRKRRVVRKTKAAAVAALNELRSGNPSVTRQGLYSKPKGEGSIVYVLHGRTHIIYVGVTDDLFRRMATHCQRPWWAQVRRVTWEELPSRAAAEAREATLILLHDPPQNRRHRRRGEAAAG